MDFARAIRLWENFMNFRGVLLGTAALWAAAIGFCSTGSGVRAEEDDKPTPHEVAAIRDCVKRAAGNDAEVESKCLFELVASPCLEKPDRQSTVGQAGCHRIEAKIWDGLLNENYKALKETLDAEQQGKLREMQQAWIVMRDRTCAFYYDKIQGTMAIPMQSACVARETARRAMLLAAFQQF
jgi:uncharacterized protein YecT (DUF1311 family)